MSTCIWRASSETDVRLLTGLPATSIEWIADFNVLVITGDVNTLEQTFTLAQTVVSHILPLLPYAHAHARVQQILFRLDVHPHRSQLGPARVVDGQTEERLIPASFI